jgi:hypothetical protein
MLLERRFHQQELPLAIEILVRDVPAVALVARDMAEGEVARHPIEAVGRGLGEEQRIARAERHRQPGRIIVGGVEAFGPDLVDEAEQFLRIAGQGSAEVREAFEPAAKGAEAAGAAAPASAAAA